VSAAGPPQGANCAPSGGGGAHTIEPLVLLRAPTDPVGVLLFRLSRGFALAGGLVLVAMTLMSLASIVGRAVFAHPLPGDYELVQLGCAIAVAAFLPLCQMRGGHVLVDFFTANSRPAVRASLDTLGAFLVGLAAAVFAWRLTAGALGLKEANDQTTILAIPTWWAVALMVPSFALFSLTGFYTAWRHWRARAAADVGP
jgi:TRAP-type C4-dicarboxylate transport system permease small subunit